MMRKIEKAHRWEKIILLLSSALSLSIVFADNILAYDINFEYIQHIMSMDTTLKHPKLYWRAVHNPILYHACFILIILFEGVSSLLLWIGAYHLIMKIHASPSDFQSAKSWSLLGLLLALILYSFIFFTIASQWFASWQSALWNAKNASLPFIILLGLNYLILVKNEEPNGSVYRS